MNLFSRHPRSKEIPINVMVLGFPESGKTVLLTTMYHQLSIPGSAGFYLHAKDDSKHNELMGLYKQIADPKERFPDPTISNIIEWEFSGLIKSVGMHYNPLKFTYSDYSGELAKNLLKKDYTALETQFANRLKDADVVLSILDGQKILNLMKGATKGDFYAQLQMMLNIMTTREKPVHFILTKWDLLCGKYQLEEIIEQLENFDPFRNFLASHTALSKLRLIPVSSVGTKFVREENGTMQKITDATAEICPFQAEMPIACILPDLIEARNKRRQQAWIVRVFRFFLSKVSFSVSIGVLSASIDHPFDNRDTTSKKLEEHKLPGIQTIRNKKDALKYVYWFFAIIVDILEFDFPASNITRHKNITRLKKGYLP